MDVSPAQIEDGFAQVKPDHQICVHAFRAVPAKIGIDGDEDFGIVCRIIGHTADNVIKVFDVCMLEEEGLEAVTAIASAGLTISMLKLAGGV